jgi:hypothetical protein
MNKYMDNNQILLFVKSFMDFDRLRIVGLLAHKPARLADIIGTLGFAPSAASHHLAQLIRVGVVCRAGDCYDLNATALESLAREQMQGTRQSYLPQPDMEDDRRKALAAHLNPDGTLKTIPLQPAKRHIILEYLLNAFSVGVTYTGKDTNTLLAHFHPDTAALRRYLVDAGMLERERDGSRYWRPK